MFALSGSADLGPSGFQNDGKSQTVVFRQIEVHTVPRFLRFLKPSNATFLHLAGP